MKIIIDGKSLADENSFHDLIDEAAKSVGFVGYGRNLDAFRDLILRIFPYPLEIHWKHAQRSREAIGPCFDRILAILQEMGEFLGKTKFKVRLDP